MVDITRMFPCQNPLIGQRKGAIGRVHNQGNIGCFACSVAGALEALNFIRTGTFVPLSAVHLHNIYAEYVKRRGDSFTGGGDHVEVFQCIIKFGGLLSENFYASMVEEIDFTDKTTMVRLSKYGGGLSDTTDLMRMVSHQPVVVPVYAEEGDGGLIEYTTGICRGIVGEHIKEGELIFRNHSMLLVGYGFFEGERCWKLLNSWGKEGFVWIPMDAKSRFTDLSAFYPIILVSFT